MIVERHNGFEKAYNKRIASHPKLAKKVAERLLLFAENSQNILLQDHSLGGNKLGLRAFSITGDIRVIYKQIEEDCVRLLDIGSHNQVY